MPTLLEYLLIGLAVSGVIGSFFLYKIITFLFFRSLRIRLARKVGDTYQVFKTLKKPIKTKKFDFEKGRYIVDLSKGVNLANNNIELTYESGKANPMTYFEGERNNAETLQTIVKADIWSRIFTGALAGNIIIILLIMMGAAILFILYLTYQNSQLTEQVKALSFQLNYLVNATKGVVIK